MILPIVLYGDPVLRKVCSEISSYDDSIKKLIGDMFETMNHAKGVGLAAPQVGKPLRLFIIDPSNYDDDSGDEKKKTLQQFKRVFINPVIRDETGSRSGFNEGCLSIPGIREEVTRHESICVKYYDENFVEQEENFTGLPARIVLHENDHINGILFIDKINRLRKQLLKRKLSDISKGIVDVTYRIKIPAASQKGLPKAV